ncbi:hypothetical protein C8R44DRAFT_853342 [Mycena epipterygia]|nr:hypothetical protein C8R44DRAFT_853342 [Mycena epipterygia]
MSHRRTKSVESTCTVLTCTSDEFWDFFGNDKLSTIELVQDSLRNVIHPNRERLRQSDARYRLDNLLDGMLQQAPHPSGQRYAAVALHIAHEKGIDTVINVAKAWTEPASSLAQTPTMHIEGAERSEPSKLRDTIAAREQNRYAIIGAFDSSFVTELLKQGREKEIPDAPQLRMQVAHVIPVLLDDLDYTTGITSEIKDTAHTCNMLQLWTNVDLGKLAGSNINSPSNTIFMTGGEQDSFRTFDFYLDEQAYPNSPNKYKARMVQDGRRFSNAQVETDVEFRVVDGTEPPDPQFLRIHAAFAKVLNLCGAVHYFYNIEQEAESATTLRMDGTTDFGSLLMSRLPRKVIMDELSLS